MKGFGPISAHPPPGPQEPLSFHDEKDFNCNEGRECVLLHLSLSASYISLSCKYIQLVI